MYTATIRPTPFVLEPVASLGRKVGNCIATHAPSLTICCLRIVAVAISIFGEWGQKAANHLRLVADKVYFIHVMHPQYRVKQAPLPILVPSMNLARRDVVYNDEDIASANCYRNLILSNQFQTTISSCSFDKECYDKLRAMRFSGARTQGICQSATLVFIQTVLQRKPSAEEALKKIAAVFEEGFPKEAAGLYEIYDALEVSSRKKIKEEMDREFTKVNGLLDKTESQSEIALLMSRAKDLHTQAKRRLLEIKEKTFQVYCSILGMSLKGSPEKSYACDFTDFSSRKKTQERFDALPLGVYYLGFSTENSGHAIAFLKYDFGTYLFDPNKGLMKCDESKPSSDFTKLSQTYRKDNDTNLVVFPTVLAPQSSP